MSIGEYVLQVTPKRIEFLDPDNSIKTVSTQLEFGDLLFKSPYARFIRNNQGSFYGQRLKLHNNLNSNASISLIGINNNEEEIVLLKVPINIMEFAQSDETAENTYQDETLKFIYEVSAFQRQISDEDYEEILSNKGSDRPMNSQCILQNILNSDLQQKHQNPQIETETPLESDSFPIPVQTQTQAPEPPQSTATPVPLSRSITNQSNKQLQLPQTPRLRQQFDEQIADLKLDQSPIVKRLEVEEQHPQGLNRVRRSSLRNQSSILSIPQLLKQQQKPLQKSPSGSRVRFIEPVLEPRETKLKTILTYILYFTISMSSFFFGIYLKQNK